MKNPARTRNLRCSLVDDGRVVYLYLQGERAESFPMTAVWVRNRAKAPRSLELERCGRPVRSFRDAE